MKLIIKETFTFYNFEFNKGDIVDYKNGVILYKDHYFYIKVETILGNFKSLSEHRKDIINEI